MISTTTTSPYKIRLFELAVIGIFIYEKQQDTGKLGKICVLRKRFLDENGRQNYCQFPGNI